MQMGEWLSLPLMVVLAGLLVVECALDKVTTVGRSPNWAMVPVRMASGAVVLTIVIVDRGPSALLGPMMSFQYMKLPGGLLTLAPWLITGAIIAGVVAVAKAVSRTPTRTPSAGVSSTLLSCIEDVVAVVGSLLGVFYVPLVPFLLVVSLLFFYRRGNPTYRTGSISDRPAL